MRVQTTGTGPTIRLTMIFTEDETGEYIVSCPELPGLFTQGESIEEGRRMFDDALSGYLVVMQKRGIPLPTALRANTHSFILKNIDCAEREVLWLHNMGYLPQIKGKDYHKHPSLGKVDPSGARRRQGLVL